MRAFVRDIPKSVFFLDYDGTLCPHLEVWEAGEYDSADIFKAVANLAKKSNGVFWNTGRRVESLKSVNEKFIEYPGFFVHGSLHWQGGDEKTKILGKELPKEIMDELTEKFREEGQFRLELKPTAGRIASFRKAHKGFLKKFVDSLNVKLPAEWEWRFSNRGAELLLKGCSKGSAVEYAYSGNLVPADAVPVVAGDDVFDRPAMEFALARGGYAVLVGEGCGWITEVPHKASQVIYFREPKDFLQFIKSI